MESVISSLRILTKGKIENLSNGFSLSGETFSVFVRPKTQSMETSIIADVRLFGDDETGPFPLPLGDWTPGLCIEIPANAIDLDKYDVFWGSGAGSINNLKS